LLTLAPAGISFIALQFSDFRPESENSARAGLGIQWEGVKRGKLVRGRGFGRKSISPPVLRAACCASACAPVFRRAAVAQRGVFAGERFRARMPACMRCAISPLLGSRCAWSAVRAVQPDRVLISRHPRDRVLRANLQGALKPARRPVPDNACGRGLQPPRFQLPAPIRSYV